MASRIAPPSITELTGTVERILFASDTDAFIIARLFSGACVKGPIEGDPLDVGTAYRFLGRWVEHAKWGRQFSFTTFVRDCPLDTNGIIKYLIDTIDGVGRKKAAALTERFREQTLDILRDQPEQIADSGILTLPESQAASELLRKRLDLDRTRIDLFGLFHGRGFPQKSIKTCIEKWGAKAPTLIRRDPFLLLTAEVPGAGFKRCDKLYLERGGRPDRLKRQSLCIWNFLRSDSSGHTWIGATQAAVALSQAIGREMSQPVKATKLAKRAKWIVSRKDAEGKVWIAEREKATNEWNVSEHVRRLLAYDRNYWPTAFDNLSEHQADRVRVSLSSPLGILGGTPGTGKTYTAAAVVKAIIRQHGVAKVCVVAPTGKAAVRITSAMHSYGLKQVFATTIHRKLEIGRNGHDGKGWGFKRNAIHPLDETFVIVDETSMVDTDLMSHLLAACSTGTHVLLVGDEHQLPPVGHGAPLRDLIAAGVPYGGLTEIRRNAGLIVHACRDIKEGREFITCQRFDPTVGDNLRIVDAKNPQDAIAKIEGLLVQFRASRKFDPVWGVQLLVAVNAKSELGRRPLNTAIQSIVNPNGVRVDAMPFRVGDKIICLKNAEMSLAEHLSEDGPEYDPAAYYCSGREEDRDYVANGEIGRVLAIAPGHMFAQFEEPTRIFKIAVGKTRGPAGDTDDDQVGDQAGERNSNSAGNEKGQGCDFDLAYAVTCHKLQGSESPCVIIVVDEHAGAKRICTREWIYTAVSRARSLCILVGRRSTAMAMVRRVSLERRKTFLKELLLPAESASNNPNLSQ